MNQHLDKGAAARPIQRREGFVQQQEIRARCQRARQRDPAFFAAGEIAHPAVQQRGDIEEPRHLFDRGRAWRRAAAGIVDIPPHTEMGEKPRILEDQADAAPVRRQR